MSWVHVSNNGTLQSGVKAREGKRIMDSFTYIRDYYGIAVTKGMHVEDRKGRRGVAVRGTNYVFVRREGEKGTVPYHPEALRYPSLGYVGSELREVKK
jgi:hypothetical protein